MFLFNSSNSDKKMLSSTVWIRVFTPFPFIWNLFWKNEHFFLQKWRLNTNLTFLKKAHSKKFHDLKRKFGVFPLRSLKLKKWDLFFIHESERLVVFKNIYWLFWRLWTLLISIKKRIFYYSSDSLVYYFLKK